MSARNAEVRALAARLRAQGYATVGEILDYVAAMYGLSPATVRKILARRPEAAR